MITRTEIEQYADRQPSTVKEVFSSLIQNDSPTTKKLVTESLKDAIKRLLIKSEIEVLPTDNWMEDIAKRFEIDELIQILTAASDKEKAQFWFKVQNFLAGPALLKMLGYITDLKLKNLTADQRGQVGDGMVLACLYLNLKR